ncbi:MAG: endonuclease/exonuclease/phosphatase family protein [Gemmatimonadaceae bacterium]|nr:endonuclease/exonuclease/phosphatase family protein [Gemmatimonadaceae bacterium]
MLAILAWGALAGMVGVTILMWQAGDRWPVATILLFIGRWVYLIPIVGIALLVRRRNRALLLPTYLALWIALFPVMGLRTGWRRMLPGPDGPTLRIVSFNTAASPIVTDSLEALLERWGADVVALQECSASLAQRLPAIRGFHAHAVRPLCLLSRFPIVAAESMERSSLERVRNEGLAGVGGAGYVVRYVLETPAGPVGFTNLHLETARKGLEPLLDGFDLSRLRDNSDLRDIEARRARAWVDGGLVPMIVAGDFNAPREGRNFADHWGDLRNAFDQVGQGFGYTRYNGWIRVRIDHVLYGDGLRAVTARVAGDAWSDHRPLIVELRRVRLDP